MNRLLALVFAMAGIGSAVVMFTLKTYPASRASSGFIYAVTRSSVHPAWATAAGLAFLLVGLGLAAAMLVLDARRPKPTPSEG